MKRKILLAPLVLICIAAAVVLLNPAAEGVKAPENAKSIAFFVLDGVSAYYLSAYPELYPHYLEGEFIEKPSTENLGAGPSAVVFRYAETVVPETTAAHSHFLIAGDCGKSAEKVKGCVDNAGVVSVCDFARRKGYLCLMVSQGGDFREARSEFDVAFFDSSFGAFIVERNCFREECFEVEQFFNERLKAFQEYEPRFNESEIAKHTNYSRFLIDVDLALLQFLEEKLPQKKFLLFSNIKGTDTCGHRESAVAYAQCVEQLDEDLQPLLGFLEGREEIVSAFTADHGMAFKCRECKGTHASPPFSETLEVRRVPFILLNAGEMPSNGRMNSFDVFPTLFSLAGLENSCREMRYCKGKDLSS